jgi:GT2 family glycosyltransferase
MKEVIISILTYNKLSYTKICLDFLFERTSPYYRVIVSDNGSTDGTIEYLESLGNKIHLIKNSENLGFAKAHNTVIDMYPMHDVILMNNDIEVPYNWLERLTEFMEKGNYGAVSPAIIVKNGLDVGAVLDKNARGKSIISDSSVEPDWITGSCLYIKRSTLNKIGKMDDNFKLYFEDVDFCIRMKKCIDTNGLGIKFACDWNTQIVHHNSVSSNPQQKKIYMEESRKYFIEKHSWGK